ncbi:MBL fold metallo-hydrolase [Paraburkholderia fynbosensis]|uniref:Metallo-beta-lactamase domain-containing protein n=1 Tax=Paraburkholderia fynbosensis TaxID=1200993 RepID=A0A6J5GW07_9BURK|nr:MBL fold metallo-hydrolase [Paraburkholderia fynbosensis]CAB3804719.1 hypothetical protein LMG27177_05730 [Paraburkholderia fynbosensis]
MTNILTRSIDAPVPSKINTQVPGYYRIAVGDFEITALYDGYVDFDRNLFMHAPDSEIQALLQKMYINAPAIQGSGNIYVVNTGSNLILVDTGAADTFGESLGWVERNLIASGYQPSQIDTVLMTHLHADHVAGLIAADGSRAFPNADIYVAKREADFWLSDDPQLRAPDAVAQVTQIARRSVAPYIEAGRFKTFEAGDMLAPGVRSMPLPGHTPGHTGFVFTSEGERFFTWGDAIHNQALQFARPEIAIEFDVDTTASVATRRAILAEAASTGEIVSAAHLPFPGMGRVRIEGDGYAWVPLEFGPVHRAEHVHIYTSSRK